MTVGHNTEPTELDKQLANLTFYCIEPNGFNNAKYEHYKKQLVEQYSNENNYNFNVIQLKNNVVQSEPKSAPLSLGPMDSPWPIKCHDVHHTGQSPYGTADNPGIEKWRFSDDHWIEINPVIDSDGVVYICDDWGVIKAVYPNGTMKWKFTAGGQTMGSSPAIAEDGTVYVGSWDSKLYAINSDGTLKWKFPASDANIASSSAIAEDGTIYFGCMGPGDYGRIYAVYPNGTEKWHYDTGYWICSDAAIGDDGTVYIGSGDTYLYAMNSNGTLKWRFKTGGYVKGPPSIAEDETIYIGSYDDYLYALYSNGTKKWRCAIGDGSETNPSIGNDGTIYIGGNYLYAIYPNGTLKWKFSSSGFIHQSSPAISADGTIYFGTDDTGMIYAVNTDGTERWRKRIADEWVESSPSIAEDGTVYIGSSCSYGRGYLHAFGPIESNSPPNAPSISGPSNVKVGEKYWYIFTAVDPDRNPIQLYVDWGDGSSGWIGEYASEEKIWVEHEWKIKGTYMVKAKVKDVLDEESGWGYLEVKVPFNLQINQYSSSQLLLKMLQRILLNIR